MFLFTASENEVTMARKPKNTNKEAKQHPSAYMDVFGGEGFRKKRFTRTRYRKRETSTSDFPSFWKHTHTHKPRSSQGLPRTSPASSESRPRHGPRPRGAKSATFCSSRPGCEHQGGPEPQNCWSLETNLSVPALPHPRWASTPTSEAPYSRHPKTHQPRFLPLPPTSTTDR